MIHVKPKELCSDGKRLVQASRQSYQEDGYLKKSWQHVFGYMP